jgi:uncharacterized protein involved in exopolysaccharide biosynthesis
LGGNAVERAQARSERVAAADQLDDPRTDAEHPNHRRPQPGAVREIESRHADLQREVEQLAGTSNDIRRALDEYDGIQLELQNTHRNVVSAQEQYQSSLKRYGNPNAGRGVSLLNAPERIKVIDAPKDPEFPSVSDVVFVLSGLAGGALLGGALAYTAELLDDTIRHSDELVAITGVPVIARLPRLSVDHSGRARRSSARRWFIFAAILLAGIGLGVLSAVRPDISKDIGATVLPLWSSAESLLRSWF